MHLEKHGIRFSVLFDGGTSGSPYEPPTSPEIQILGWEVPDWDELADYYGTDSGSLPYASLQEIVDNILENFYDDLLKDAIEQLEEDYADRRADQG